MSIFGSEDWPLRPSKLKSLVSCPMSVYLDGIMIGDDEGGPGAQTGSVVHAGVEAFHRTMGDPITRREEATAAARAALPTFPAANENNAFRWLSAYTNDTQNITANVTHIEEKVCLIIPAEPDIVIRGTLDQVRQDSQGRYTVWDLKTGTSLSADEVVDEYQFQQAAYVLAARQTLGLNILPGGIIYAAGYDKPRGRRFLPMGVDLDDCEAMMEVVKSRVLDIRAGKREFTPSNSACFWCEHKRYPKCRRLI